MSNDELRSVQLQRMQVFDADDIAPVIDRVGCMFDVHPPTGEDRGFGLGVQRTTRIQLVCPGVGPCEGVLHVKGHETLHLQHEKQTRVYLFCEDGHHWVLSFSDHSGCMFVNVHPLGGLADDD